jgi:hypothetical protein
VLSSALESARNAAWNAAKFALIAGAIAILALGGLIFLTLAAFIWAEGAYGALAAAAGLRAVFLVLALAFAALARFQSRRSYSSRNGSQALQQAGQDPAVAAGLEVLRLGPKNVFPALALGAVILAAAQAVRGSKSKPEAAE